MNYKITVNNQTYDVKIEDIHARPVVAFVDGERVEILPEEGHPAETKREAVKTSKKTFDRESKKSISPSPNPAISGNSLTAPLPGTVVDVFVKAGDRVEAGQVVLIIEAMKMKNSIRSVFSGTIHEVLVSKGQSVAHKQVLIKFADLGEASWM